MYVNIPIMIIIVMSLIALYIGVYPALVLKGNLNTFATEIVREAEVTGRIGDKVDERIGILEDKLQMNPSISWSTSYISGNKVQLNEIIEVTVEHDYEINVGAIGSFSVTLQGKASGKSEVFWK